MEIASARLAAPRLASAVGLLVMLAGGAGCGRRAATPGAGRPGETGPAAAYGGAIAGRVIDRRGDPVPDAAVIAFVRPAAAGPARATTDVHGRFALAAVPPGVCRLLVEAAGFPAAEATTVVTQAAADVVIRLDGEGRAVVGRVEHDGAGVVGASVWLADAAGGATRQTRAGDDGAFAFSGLGAGTYALVARYGRLASPVLRGVTVAGAGAGSPARLALAPGQLVTGRVIADPGTPLAGVDARVEDAGLPPNDDPLAATARTDARGDFSSGPLPPGRYRVSAAAPGYLLRRAVTIDVAEAAPPSSVVLALVRGARVTGRVVDARGAPLPGASVRSSASAIEDLAVQPGPLPLAAEAAALPARSGRALGSARGAVADRAGRFTIEDLIPGRYRLEVAQQGLAPARTGDFALDPGATRDLGAVVLQDGYPIEGVVSDRDGSPIESARVVVDADGAGADAVAGLFTTTDAGGRFTLVVPAGTVRLLATASGFSPARLSFAVGPAVAPPPRPALKLARADATLEGQVRDTGGRPLARARLVVRSASEIPDSAPDQASLPLGGGVTDVGGHFRIAGLPAGALRLAVEHADYPATTFTVTPGRLALVTVPFPGGVTGEVHARATGAVVARGHIDATGPDGARARADLQRAGAFKLLRLVPGRWRLTVTAAGFSPGDRDVDVPPSASLGEASVTGVRVELDGS